MTLYQVIAVTEDGRKYTVELYQDRIEAECKASDLEFNNRLERYLVEVA